MNHFARKRTDTNEEMERIKKFIFSVKTISIVMIIGTIVSMVPILMLSAVNRATGDDLGYGLLTHHAWLDTHSLTEVFRAMCQTVHSYYYSWQGTWFSIALFTLQPEVFSPDAYWIVAPMMLLFLGVSSFVLIYYFCNRIASISKYGSVFIAVSYFFLVLQFVPSTKSAIFWYNGCAHYMIPFSMCLALVYLLLRYCRNHGKGTYIAIAVILTLLGGSNYQAALLGLIVTVLAVGISLLEHKDRKCLWLLVPFLCCMSGLLVSMKAPGNQVRAGGGLDFSLSKVLGTIGKSFVFAFEDVVGYLRETPIIFVLLLMVLLVLVHAMLERSKNEIVIKYPILSIILLICIYAAMQAPEVYAEVSVSGGVPNTNYMVFLLMAFGIIFIIAERIAIWISTKGMYYQNIWLILLGLCMMMVLVLRYDLKESTTFECYDYISEGRAQDFKECMEEYDKILFDDSIKDVELPPVNDDQGPLMYMPVIEDENAFTNWAVKEFYSKERVVMVWD